MGSSGGDHGHGSGHGQGHGHGHHGGKGGSKGGHFGGEGGGKGHSSHGSRSSTYMTPERASAIQSHADKTGRNEDFKERAMSAADKHENNGDFDGEDDDD